MDDAFGGISGLKIIEALVNRFAKGLRVSLIGWQDARRRFRRIIDNFNGSCKEKLFAQTRL